MSSSANTAHVTAHQTTTGETGQPYTTFKIRGTATCNGTAGIFNVLDGNGVVIRPPRASYLENLFVRKSTSAGSTNVSLCKSGTEVTAAVSANTLGSPSNSVTLNALASGVSIADLCEWSSTDYAGIKFSASAIDAVDVVLEFRAR